MAKKRKRGPVASKKFTVDGITFRSGLERYMYQQLKANKLFEKYEEEKFTLVEGFTSGNECWERQSNSKGEFKERGDGKKILGISYKPDFTGQDYIIECKGRPNESFPLRWKLFRRHLIEVNDTRVLYKPQNQKECDITIQQILKNRK